MTDLFGITAALIPMLLLNLWIARLVRLRADRAEGAFLARTYLQSLALRAAGALLLNVFATESQFAQAFWGDSSTYDSLGHILALYWKGEAFVDPMATYRVSGWGFSYFVGAVYYVFGQNQFVVQLLNATIGSLAVVVVHSVAKQIFDSAVARWAALCMAFFPQMVFWSCAMYKDPSILLCIALAIYAIMRLRERITLRNLALFVLAMLALMSLRFYIFYMVAFATLGTFLFAQRRGLLSSVVSQVVLAIVFISAIAFGVRRETIEQQTAYFDLDKLQTARLDQTVQGRSGFGASIDVSTPGGAIAALPIGLVYLLFSPFPWSISGLRQALTLPETLVWYSLMPALWRGLRHTIRTRFRAALPVLAFTSILTLAYAVLQSNVGAAYRQRTQISMFFFVFIGAGIELKRNRARALAEARPRT